MRGLKRWRTRGWSRLPFSWKSGAAIDFKTSFYLGVKQYRERDCQNDLDVKKHVVMVSLATRNYLSKTTLASCWNICQIFFFNFTQNKRKSEVRSTLREKLSGLIKSLAKLLPARHQKHHKIGTFLCKLSLSDPPVNCV